MKCHNVFTHYTGHSILHEALGKCKETTLAMVVSKNANLHALNTSHETVLEAAIKLGKADFVDMLIKSESEYIVPPCLLKQRIIYVISFFL